MCETVTGTRCPICRARFVGKLCSDCGGRHPQRWVEGVAVCCDWEMITLPGPEAVESSVGERLVCTVCERTVIWAGRQ